MRIFIIPIIFSFLFSGLAFAEAEGPDHFQLKEGHVAWLHKDAAINAETILKITDKNASLTNMGCKGFTPLSEWTEMTQEEKDAAKDKVWCKVLYGDVEGWVHNKYLKEYSVPSKPVFNCDKASGDVEMLICEDEALTKLDQNMTRVFDLSAKTAYGLKTGADEAVETLKSTQDNWIKERNACSKEQDEQKACVVQQYERRIAYLEAKWSLVPRIDAYTYRCEASPESDVIITYYNTKTLPSLALEYGGDREIFFAARSASGAKYEDSSGRYFWMKGDDATFLWDQGKDPISCRLVEA